MTVTDTPVHPARRPDLEAWLEHLGATWIFDGDLPLDRIDQAASLANQARNEALNADIVDRYTASMRRGDQFPPLIARDDHDHITLLGGNHRYAAHRNNHHSTAHAYLVTCDDPTATRIRFEDNAKHGLPPTVAERIAHAVELMRYGTAQNDAAAIVGIPAPKLSIAASCITAGERARRLDVVDTYHRLPEATRYQLSQVDDDHVFSAAANLAGRAAMRTGDVAQLVRAVNAVDPTEALRIVGAEEADLEQRAHQQAGKVRTGGRSARARFDGALAEIRGLNPVNIYESCPNDDVRAVLAQRIMDTAGTLMAAHELLTGRRAGGAS